MWKLMLIIVLVSACSAADDHAAADAQEPASPVLTQTVATTKQTTQKQRAAPPVELPSAAGRLQPVQIINRWKGADKPMVAYTLMIPMGWKAQGEMMWTPTKPGCGKLTPHIAWSASTPDDLTGIQIIPEEAWLWHDAPDLMGNPCAPVAVTDTRQFITQYVLRHRPGARILDYRDRSDVLDESQKPQPAWQLIPDVPGAEERWSFGAGQALIAYNQNGHDMRELIGTSVEFHHGRNLRPNGKMMKTLVTETFRSFAIRAPEGRLDFEFAERLVQSAKANPAHQAKLTQYHALNRGKNMQDLAAQHNATMAAMRASTAATLADINAAGAASRANAQTNSEIRDMQHDSWLKRQESNDTSQRESLEGIREVETYNDPYNGGTQELDNNYEHAWQLNDGTNVLTNDPFFNPYTEYGQDGQELQPAP